MLSRNRNAIHILEKNLDKVNWSGLSTNPNAIHILEKNPDKIKWHQLSGNPNAIHILEKNLDKLDWSALSANPNAIHILEKNPDKITDYWYYLSLNPNIHLIICKLDYKEMKSNTKDFSRELTEDVFHPERLIRICQRNDLDFCDLLEVL